MRRLDIARLAQNVLGAVWSSRAEWSSRTESAEGHSKGSSERTCAQEDAAQNIGGMYGAYDAHDVCDVRGVRGVRAVRPGVTGLFVVACFMWITCAAAFTALETATLETSLVVLCVGAFGVFVCLVLLVLLALLARLRRASLLLAALGLTLGLCCASGAACAMKQEAQVLCEQADTWTFALVEDTKQKSYGAYAKAHAQGASGAHATVRVMFDGQDELLCGTRFRATLTLDEVSEASRSFCWTQGISLNARVSSYELVEDASVLGTVRALRAQAVESLGAYGGEHAGLLQALACGYRVSIEQTGAYEAWKAAGLAHLVAVSGAHLAIVVALVSWTLSALRVPRTARMAISAAFVIAYLVLAGVPVSAVRAAFMVLLALAAPLAQRRHASLNALALCVILFIALDPAASVSASFFLSAGSTLGILAFSRLVASWMTWMPSAAFDLIAEPLSLTAASNVMTLPYSAALFSQLSLVAPLANLVAAPLFGVACASSLLAGVAACAFPFAAEPIVSAAGMVVTPLETAVAFMAAIPFASIAVDVPVLPMVALSCVACVALWALWPKVGLRGVLGCTLASFALAAMLLVIAPALGPDEVVMFDVGQGDAFLVRSKGASVLIDTGNQDALLRAALGRHGVYSLDALVVTHADDDHCGSIDALGSVTHVGQVCVAADAQTCPCTSCERLRTSADSLVGTSHVHGLEVGDVIEVGHFTLEVVWPYDFTDLGGNADSLCLLARFDGDEDGQTDWSALFLGDAEAEELERIVSDQGIRQIDVLKVGHHGSRVSLTEELACSLNPKIALISCGANNRYGHPTAQALACLDAACAQVLRTDQTGDAELVFTADSIKVTCSSP